MQLLGEKPKQRTAIKHADFNESQFSVYKASRLNILFNLCIKWHKEQQSHRNN